MNNKQTTIEDLAVMIKKGFDGVDEKFKSVDEQFKGVNGRLDRLENDVKDLKDGQERIYARLSNVVYKFEFDALERRVAALEQKA